jgi:replication factor A1
VLATFTTVDPDGKLWYEADVDSGRKVVPKDGGWWCEYDQTSKPAMTRRYIVAAKVADATGEASVTLFDDAAAALLGASADDLAALKDADPPAFAAALGAALWKPAVLRVAAKTQEYQGEARRRLVVHSVGGVEWGAEARRAAAELAALEVKVE